MKVAPIASVFNNISFKAGKTSLYTDFDGTFLAQPLHDLYRDDDAKKKSCVDGFNNYFAQFQNFIQKAKGKFEIIITTGRRLFGDRVEGFEPTYEKITQDGIKLPEIKALITASGGDIHYFNADGTIGRTFDAQKTESARQACGWDNDKIKSALDEAAAQTGTDYHMADCRGSYKLSVHVENRENVNDFYSKLKDSLDGQMQIKSRIDDVRVYGENERVTIERGIKLAPKINGHSLNKDFDVKIALKNAERDNDFVIAAGDSTNDKAMINIFSYIELPGDLKHPTRAQDLTPEHIQAVRAIKLPLKIFFIRPDEKQIQKNARMAELYEFMKEQERLFPDKVKIVEQTQLGGENNLLNAVKSAISDHAGVDKKFAEALEGNGEFAKEFC